MITRGLRVLTMMVGLIALAPSVALAAPVATTAGATDIAGTSATLNGVADPVDPDSAYQFQYGTSTSYGSYSQATAIGKGQRAVSAAISGLSPGTTYHFRLIVLQGSYAPAMSAGDDVTFTTPEQPPALIGATPAISGTAQEGQTLTETHGVWSNSPTGYAYQWYDCADQTPNCAAIVGATSQSYTIGAADIGSTIRIVEVASNEGGQSLGAASAPTSVVLPTAPSPTAPDPSISGVTTQGQTLTESHGGWSSAPAGYAYQWEDCDASGNSCAAIAGATGQTYTLGAGDVGSTIRVLETAGNAGGASAPRSSPATAAVQGLAVVPQTAPPVNSIPPSVTGTARVGFTLSATTGAWSGTTPITYAYQWRRCAPQCSDITGATASTYRPTQADVGAGIGVLVTATNLVGSGAAVSSPIGPVPATSPARPNLSGLLHAPAGAAALLQADGEKLSFTAPEAGRLSILWYARSRHRRVLVAQASAVFERAQRGTISLTLTPAGDRLLLTGKLLRITAEARFTPVGGRPVTASRSFTL